VFRIGISIRNTDSEHRFSFKTGEARTFHSQNPPPQEPSPNRPRPSSSFLCLISRFRGRGRSTRHGVQGFSARSFVSAGSPHEPPLPAWRPPSPPPPAGEREWERGHPKVVRVSRARIDSNRSLHEPVHRSHAHKSVDMPSAHRLSKDSHPWLRGSWPQRASSRLEVFPTHESTLVGASRCDDPVGAARRPYPVPGSNSRPMPGGALSHDGLL